MAKSRRRKKKKTPPKVQKQSVANETEQIKRPQIRSFAVITLVYIVAVVALGLLLEFTVATIIATPIWAFLYLLFAQSNENNPLKNLEWRNLVKVPRLNYWNLVGILLSMLAVQVLVGIVLANYQHSRRPDFYHSLPDDPFQGWMALVDDPQSIIVLILTAVVSYFIGGYVAGKLPNKKCPAPYRHGIVSTIFWNLISYSFVIPLSMLSDEEPPSREDIGLIILATSPSYLFSAFGTWLAVRKNKPTTQTMTSSPKVKDGDSDSASSESTNGSGVPWFRRRKVIWFTAVLLIVIVVFVVWYRRSNSPGSVECQNPPATATLNYWPVTYTGVEVACHDFPPVDARLVSADHYSQSREEWERGLIVKPGDEFYVLVYINNGAADHAEYKNPGKGIARNVRLTTEVSDQPSDVHYVKVEFSGDNTATVVSRFKITTEPNGRLLIVPKSGEIFKFNAELMSKNLEVGNNQITIGDLEPKWDASVFVRFRVKVGA